MLPVLVGVVVAADEVLGMTEGGEPRGQSHPHSVSPTAGSGAGRGVGCTHGGNWHRELRNADLHPLPIPPPRDITPVPSKNHSSSLQDPPPGACLALCSLSVVLVKAESRANKLSP